MSNSIFGDNISALEEYRTRITIVYVTSTTNRQWTEVLPNNSSSSFSMVINRNTQALYIKDEEDPSPGKKLGLHICSTALLFLQDFTVQRFEECQGAFVIILSNITCLSQSIATDLSPHIISLRSVLQDPTAHISFQVSNISESGCPPDWYNGGRDLIREALNVQVPFHPHDLYPSEKLPSTFIFWQRKMVDLHLNSPFNPFNPQAPLRMIHQLKQGYVDRYDLAESIINNGDIAADFNHAGAVWDAWRSKDLEVRAMESFINAYDWTLRTWLPKSFWEWSGYSSSLGVKVKEIKDCEGVSRAVSDDGTYPFQRREREYLAKVHVGPFGLEFDV